jgi:hypothetical protein
MGYLNIDTLQNISEVSALRLHEIENSLSSLVATIFWIGGAYSMNSAETLISLQAVTYGQVCCNLTI